MGLIITGRGGEPETSSTQTATPTEDPNTIQSNSILRITDLLCEGPIAGFCYPDGTLTDVYGGTYLDGVVVRSQAGDYNFSGISADARNGYPSQSALSGYSDIESLFSVGAELEDGTPLTRITSSPDVNAVRVTIALSSLYTYDSSTGNLTYNGAQFGFYVRPIDGNWTYLPVPMVWGKTRSQWEIDYHLDLRPYGQQGPFEIRVCRIDWSSAPAHDGSQYFSQSYWVYYTEIIYETQEFPDSVVVGYTVNSRYFGSSVPARQYLLKGMLVNLPNNYEPYSRSYNGTWDGGWTLGWTNNPAWCFNDLLTNKRYGLGMDQDDVDTAALYTIGQYCDGLVPNGFGGYETRYTFNAILQDRQDALTTLAALATVFWGMVYASSGGVTFTADMPADSVMLVTRANVVDGAFHYSGSSLKERHSVVLVKWNDPDDDYKVAYEVVEDPDMIDRYGWITTEVQMIGCTSRGQAHRYGKWILDTEHYSTETITYQAGFDHVFVMPGDIVDVQDPSYAGARLGGRITAITDETDHYHVTLDAAVTLTPGGSTLGIVIPNATDDGYTVSHAGIWDGPGTWTMLSVPKTWSIMPEVGSLFVVSAADAAPRKFRIVSKTEVEPLRYEFTGVYHDPTKYARIEQNLDLPEPTYSRYPKGAIAACTNLTITEGLYQDGPSILGFALFSWTPPRDPRVAYYDVVLYSQPSGTVTFRTDDASQAHWDFRPISPDDYTFYVRARGYLGESGQWASRRQIIFGKTNPPANVSNFSINIVGSVAYLTWDAVAELDVTHYRIKYSTVLTGGVWNQAADMVLATGTAAQVPARVGTYFIKAVDDGGRESLSATLITTNISELEGLNVVETIDEIPTFTGTMTYVSTDVDGYLVLTATALLSEVTLVSDILVFSTLDSDLALEGTYALESMPIDLGAIFICRLSSAITFSAMNLNDLMSAWTSVASRSSFTGGELAYVNVLTYVRFKDTAGAAYSDWCQFSVGDYQGRYFDFKVELTTQEIYITPVVEEIEISIDMPDRVDGDDDVVSNSGSDTAITYSPAFNAAPRVAISAQNMATGDYYTMSAKTRTGFTINFYNSSATRVSRTFDWVAKGYGYEY